MERDIVLTAIRRSPHDRTRHTILADWFDEAGDRLAAEQLRLGPPPIGLTFFVYGSGDNDGADVGYGASDGYGYGSGDGYGHGVGYGHGDGYGDGDGHGCGHGVGYGHGDGAGDGYGYGDGDGYGDGAGDGYGEGSSDGDGSGDGDGYWCKDKHPLSEVGAMPEVGKRMLIVLPHGWVICGDVTEQVGPYQFRVKGAVVVCRTGGVPWDELADGNRRSSATYREWGEVLIGPQFVMSREWKGELPKAAGGRN